MPATVENYSAGVPVEIGKIEKELKKLWEQNEGATRASLVNLAVYSEQVDSLAANTKLVSELTENLACRAIVIAANPAPEVNHVAAWISAHCHISKAGTKQICSEQLSFQLEGPCTTLLPNIVFSHLDSDLPFYFWWQGEFHDPIDPQLWAWVDRLIYDSEGWNDFTTQLQLLESAQRQARERVVLCDLNWTRLDKTRLAIAQFFDHPASHHRLDAIRSGEIEFARGYRSTAVLLAGWLGAQLGWQAQAARKDNKLQFLNTQGETIEITTNEIAGEPIGRVSLTAKEIEFEVVHPKGKDLLQVSRRKSGEPRVYQVMPGGSNSLVRLMSDELMRGGPHKVYQRAIQCIRALL
jgi:glucose-6-phosphate dehydrogenase assembly protein OpcA